MTTTSRWLTAVLAALTLATPAARLDAQDSVKVQKPTSELITREQIVEARSSTNLYDLIEGLHNNWLRERLAVPTDRNGAKPDSSGRATYTADMNAGGKSALGANGGIQVYLDGTRVGGLASLKQMSALDVYSIRRISGPDAQARFGIGHSSGVIYVSTSPNAP